MRAIVSNIAVGIVAVTAAVFAIWPVVTDAPWEQAQETTASNSSHEPVNELRCEAALELRRTTVNKVNESLESAGRLVIAGAYELAEQEIARFC